MEYAPGREAVNNTTAALGSAAYGSIRPGMWRLIDMATTAVHAHPGAALGLVFLAAVIEATAVIGLLVPGTPIMMGVAAAASRAGQATIPLVLLAILGAVIGDVASYAIGRRFSLRLRGIWPFSRKPELLERADHFFNRYGAPSVAVCRFIPVLRSTVPLAAGMARMPCRQFLIADILSATLWAPAHILPARLLGDSMDALRAGDPRVIGALVAATLALIAGSWWLHRLSFRLTRNPPPAAVPRPLHPR